MNATLAYVNYIQRHQRRTPYGVLPGGTYQPWDCDNVRPYLYSAPAPEVDSRLPMRVYAKTYTDPMNPFTEALVAPPGSCQFPQLTIGGLLDGYQHGDNLRQVYGEKLGLLPCEGPDYSTYFRSSESPLTQDTAGGVLRGLWPNHHGAISLHQEVTAVDTVNEGFSCDYRNSLVSSIQSSPEWYEHLNVSAPLLSSIEWLTQNVSTWTTVLNSISDDFTSWQCNGYNIPCDQNDTSKCVTQEQADQIFRTGDWEWNYMYRNNANATAYIQSLEGNFIDEILDKLTAVANGTSELKWVHDFLHDNDVGPIVASLGITVLRWPGLGSNVAFELWQTDSNEWYVRVLYSGVPLQTIYGALDWVPLQRIVDIMQPFVPTDIVALCSK